MITLLESQALWLTLKLASITTLILLIAGLPLSWWLAEYRGRIKPFIQAVLALPIVLPPTVLGFYLLIAFSPDSWLGGSWLALTGTQLAFSFEGILLASVIYSLPFVVQPLTAGFKQLDTSVLEAASSLGIPVLKRFWLITLPLIKPAIISAATLGFAHTLGEFGLVLMIGGNIPGETQVLSIALYDHVEALEYASAHKLSMALMAISFISLALLFKFNKSWR